MATGKYGWRFVIYLDIDTKEMLDQLSKSMGISRSAIIRMLIREKYKSEYAKAVEASEELKPVEETSKEEDPKADEEIRKTILDFLEKHKKLPWYDLEKAVHSELGGKYTIVRIGDTLSKMVEEGILYTESEGKHIYVLKK